MSEQTDRYERFTETNVVGSLIIYEWAASLDISGARDILDRIVEVLGSAPDIATVTDEKTGKDYLYRNFAKRDVITKKDWQSVGYLWKRNPNVLLDFSIDIGCSVDRFRLFEIHIDRAARCLIPGFDGSSLSSESKDALWARFCMGAPQRQRRSVERYNIVKRA
ncbi:hypothetical protein NKJ46_25880 [Mesorhizobium sp. M0166]|uniref:hypothetical protein n=1 Tax=Mesorhizobium sp. M0166 TaxID=2956902 RepID=UPI0033396BE3